MSRFNTTTQPRLVVGPTSYITSEQKPSGVTHEGGLGYARDTKSELFLLGVSNMVSTEGSFYEDATTRDERFANLSKAVAVEDLDWMVRFVRWLRNGANLRSASLVAALEGTAGLIEAGKPGGRALVDAAMSRADEPGEALAYWRANYGALPKPVKRGIADAARRLFWQNSLAKYDTSSKGYRFADVIQLTHPRPASPLQAAVFKYALDRRYNAQAEVPASLTTLVARKNLLANSPETFRAWAQDGSLAARIQEAGLSWENLSGAIAGGMDAKAWEAVIPSMGYMALLRNLRNFLDTPFPVVSQEVLHGIASRLSDPAEVAKSRQLPMRFFSAYKAVENNLLFTSAIEQALNHSLSNIPSLTGRTLVLVDRSGSMFWSYSKQSELTFADTAALFGTAIAVRAENADLVQFGTYSAPVNLRKGSSILPVVKSFGDGGGTNTAAAVRTHFKNHDRVIIITDEQTWGGYHGDDPTKVVSADVPVYTWNLNGYERGHGPSGPNRHTFGGLSDASFGLINLIERGKNSEWPF